MAKEALSDLDRATRSQPCSTESHSVAVFSPILVQSKRFATADELSVQDARRLRQTPLDFPALATTASR
eukprot:10542537-Alexandrium_andersonii.AAC.1